MAVNGVSKSAETAENPSGLPPRFEIRRLEEEHVPWTCAIICHTNIFYSGLWPYVYPDGKSKRALAGYPASDYLMRHQIESGMSFGVFDKEYKFKRPESEATGGRCYWDELGPDATADELLEAMDFPLVSIAMSYDAADPLDNERMVELVNVLPRFHTFYAIMHSEDKRDPKTWEPTGPRQVLMRNATSTRRDYEGYGCMSKLARWLMREAKKEGYRGINIECLADSVAHVWSHPPKPFTADIVVEVQLGDWEEEDEKTGEKVKVFAPSRQMGTRVYTKLE